MRVILFKVVLGIFGDSAPKAAAGGAVLNLAARCSLISHSIWSGLGPENRNSRDDKEKAPPICLVAIARSEAASHPGSPPTASESGLTRIFWLRLLNRPAPCVPPTDMRRRFFLCGLAVSDSFAVRALWLQRSRLRRIGWLPRDGGTSYVSAGYCRF